MSMSRACHPSCRSQRRPAQRELVRIWAAGGKLQVTFPTDLWSDPASWGVMLVDLAKHAANAYEQSTGMDWNAALARIRQGFDAEWGTATDTPTGTI